MRGQRTSTENPVAQASLYTTKFRIRPYLNYRSENQPCLNWKSAMSKPDPTVQRSRVTTKHVSIS